MKDNRLNILFITHSKPDWITDYLYHGLVENGHKVIDFPSKNNYHVQIPENSQDYDHLLLIKSDYPDKAITHNQILNYLKTNFFDLIITTTNTFQYKNQFLSNLIKWLKYRRSSQKEDWGWRHLNNLYRFIKIPIIAIDGRDSTNINKQNVPLLERCDLYFKREIPLLDKKEMCEGLDSNGALIVQKKIERIKPIPFGINLLKFYQLYPSEEPKTLDIAFIMDIRKNSLRERVFSKLKKINKYKMYLSDCSATNRLKIGEYIKVIKSSKITISISGLGWDCLRHYEAFACKSALMVNEPTIQAYNFSRDGESAIFFKNDLSDFNTKLDYYLKNPNILSSIAVNGHKHLSEHLDIHKIAEYFLEEVNRYRL